MGSNISGPSSTAVSSLIIHKCLWHTLSVCGTLGSMTVEQDFQLQLHLHFKHSNYTSVLQSEQKKSWERAAHISAHFGSATGNKAHVGL